MDTELRKLFTEIGSTTAEGRVLVDGRRVGILCEGLHIDSD